MRETKFGVEWKREQIRKNIREIERLANGIPSLLDTYNDYISDLWSIYHQGLITQEELINELNRLSFEKIRIKEYLKENPESKFTFREWLKLNPLVL